VVPGKSLKHQKEHPESQNEKLNQNWGHKILFKEKPKARFNGSNDALRIQSDNH
jgi:hypothetical protein